MKELPTYLGLCTQVYDLSKPAPPPDAYSFYRSYAADADGPILEPMCGTGRFLLPLRAEGFDVHGFDASPSMLEALRTKAKGRGLAPNVWRGFLEELEVRRESYSLIFIPSGSFGLLTDTAQARRALAAIHARLDAGGRFVFEIATTAYEPASKNQWDSSVWDLGDGRFTLANYLALPVVDDIVRTIGRYELVEGGLIAKTEVEDFRFRRYEVAQLVAMLDSVGFSAVRAVKPFDRQLPHSPGDREVVLECQK